MQEGGAPLQGRGCGLVMHHQMARVQQHRIRHHHTDRPHRDHGPSDRKNLGVFWVAITSHGGIICEI
eukprot:4660970-Prymnesium_polylepis.1